jgi:hypothetical protein
LTTCLLVLPVQAKYSGGSGTADDPYQIATAADLIALGNEPNDYDKHFLLTADIDLDPNLPGRKVFDKAVIGPDVDPNKDDFQGTPFTGVFDGNKHVISHLTVQGKDYLGLFGSLGRWSAPACKVKHLGLVDVRVAGPGAYVGGLAGCNLGALTQCYSTSTVSGTAAVGGLVGLNEYVSLISDCYSIGTVSGSFAVGGLAGSNRGVISRCYSIGAVTGSGQYVGGLVGSGSATAVTASFWDIQTSGLSWSYGGTGKTTAEMQMASTFLVWGCTPAIWTVDEGVDYPRLAWEIKHGEPLPALGDSIAGSGSQGDPYLICTADDFNRIGLFPREWDKHFRLDADIDMSGLDGKDGRPAFKVIGTSSAPFTGVFDGNGHKISHLTITGQDYLGLFGRLGGKVKDLGVIDVNIVGSGSFVGGLVGFSGGSVTQCFSAGIVTGGSYVGGLVGENNGTIANCHATGNVSGGDHVGGLAGLTSGRINECSFEGSVSGNNEVGGLAGEKHATVAGCFVIAQVRGSTQVGGLIGWVCCGTTEDCYAMGTVRGSGFVGGLVGDSVSDALQLPIIATSYSTSAVIGDKYVGGLVGYGGATASFWDIQTSRQSTSAGSTGKTTAEMQTAKTFLDAGWDFVGETKNGTEDIWWILDGKDYPRLVWQFWALCPGPPNGATDVFVSSTLSWRAARGAVTHDVYFGPDKAAVTNATPESPGIYRGRYACATTTYDPGLLECGTTYYWRIDEVNDSDPRGPWKGSVWSFTTTDYNIVSIVDDFESYNDREGTRVFDVWADGYVDKSSGSTVGLLNAPNGTFCETTIIHGGQKSMPFEYNNIKAPFYSEAERTFDTTQDWTLGGANGLALWSRGYPAGFTDKGNNAFTVSSEGTGIANYLDQFRFVYKLLSSNGSITVRVDSLVNTNAWAKAGVMIRETLEGNSKCALCVMTPGNGAAFEYRANTGGTQAIMNTAGLTVPHWVRITRTGNTFKGERSADGKTWTQIGVDPTVIMAPNAYVGLCVTSHNSGVYTTAEFSSVLVSGTATGAWQNQSIGVTQGSNDAAPLYVTVEDKAGKKKTVVNPDALAVNAGAWTQWKIACGDLAGVNLAGVKKLTIGVGDRANPKAGGTGRIYIDDIRLTKRTP